MENRWQVSCLSKFCGVLEKLSTHLIFVAFKEFYLRHGSQGIIILIIILTKIKEFSKSIER